MNIELRSIKVSLSLSEETNAYTATVYVDGKPAVDVSNHGTGGCDDQYPRPGFTVKALDDHLAANPSDSWLAYDWGGDGKAPTYDLEAWCGEQVDAHITRQDMRRGLKKKAIFVVDGKLYQLGYKGRGAKVDQRLLDHVRAKNPTATVLNMLPEDEALALYRQYG